MARTVEVRALTAVGGGLAGAVVANLARLPIWLAAGLLGLAGLVLLLVLAADRPAERAALLIAVLRGRATAPRLPARRAARTRHSADSR
jgi:hypothetical protein